MKLFYKFSIVTAVYNTAEYLEEMIESVIKQDIGFEDNVQLILVDDGSSDSSLSICKQYESKYPNNINVICLSHSGVSAARNEGMKYIEGKYMNFLDADDKLNQDTLQKVYKYFEAIYELTDVVSIPVHYFEGKTGEHILNYKYKTTRCINLEKEYRNVQLFINSAFIKSEYKDIFRFDENMKYAEDAEMINKILLNKSTLGVLGDTIYWYRFRNSNSSAIQTGSSKKEWYLDYLKSFSLKLIKYCLQEKNDIPKFIQYTVIYDLQWRINQFKHIRKILNEQEYSEFCSKLIEIVKKTNAKIILEQGYMKWHKKLIILGINLNICNGISKLLLTILNKI